MSAEPLLPVYLLVGSDGPKIRRALARLRLRLGEEALELLDASEATGADAAAACNAMGLFGSEGGRLVVVEGVERWKAEDVDAVAQYVADPTPGSVLALVAHEAPKTPKLAETCAKAGKVLEFDVPKPRDLPGWVRAQFERVKTPVEADAARALVEIVGENVTALTTEVEKLAAWATGEPVTRRDVERLAVPAQEASAWALTDAWGARDPGAVLAACESELEHDEQPFVIAMRLANQVALVRSAQALAEGGLGTRDIAKKVRKHEFRVRKALGHASNYSREELDDATVRLASLDAALKGGSRLAAELELERALVEVTRPREKVPTS